MKFESPEIEVNPQLNREKFLEAQRTKQLQEKAALKAKNILRVEQSAYTLSPNDLAEIKRAKSHFENGGEAKEMATILEAIVSDQGKREASPEGGWFGPNASVVAASEYDDYFRKIDSFVIFQEGSEESKELLALAIDVTFSTSSSEVRKKVEAIRDFILDPPDKSAPKYPPIPLKQNGFVPRVVIALESKTVSDLINRWAEKERVDSVSGKRNATYLAQHPAQLQILDDIVLQCQVFEEIALLAGKEKVAESYREMSIKIWQIFTAKLAARGATDVTVRDQDKGHDDLIQALNHLDSRVKLA